VRQILYSPKGDQILSAGDDKTIKIWNAADGKELKSIAAHDGPVLRLALSGDGARLVSAGADKAVKVWNLAQPKDEKPAAAFSVSGVPESLAVSGNGQRLAVATDDKTTHPIRIFDVALGREVFNVPDHAAAVHALGFLGDNRTVVSASADKTVRFSDVPLLTLFEGHVAGVSDVLFNANGAQALSAGADKTVKLWDMAKNAVIKTFGPLPEPVKALTWSKDNTLVCAASGKIIKVWNVADGKELAAITAPADVRSLALSPDKTKLAVGGADNLTRVFDVPGGKEQQFFAQDEPVTAVVFDTKNTGIVSAGGKTPRLDTLSVTRVIAVANGPLFALTMGPNNTHVLAGGVDKQVKFWNLANGANDRSLPAGAEAVRAIAVSKNNQLIAVATADQMIRVYNAADSKELGNVKASGQVRGLTFAPNNLVLAAGCADKSLHAWSAAFAPGQPLPPDFLKPIQSFTHDDAVTEIAFAADNATLFSGSLDKSVRAWKLASPTPTRNFPHPNIVDAVAFHPTLPQVATGGHDGKIRVFDLVKNAPLREINAHTGDPKQGKDPYIYALSFSPDGKYLVSGSADQSLKLWDAGGGTLVRELKPLTMKAALVGSPDHANRFLPYTVMPQLIRGAGLFSFELGHQDPIFAVAFSADGKFLASGSAGLERGIKLWSLPDGKHLRDLGNPVLKGGPAGPVPSHPGWVYNLRFTKDGKLVSIGDAPKNSGYLAVWSPQDGKLLYAETLPLGAFYGLAISPDGQVLAIGAGPRVGAAPDFNSAYLMRMPVK
jgi:WD40 repeat protein